MNARTIVSTTRAPLAIGPYSQAVKSGGLVFVAGQIALHPDTQEIVDGDVGAHTDRALRNVQAILRAAGSELDRVLRCVVYLTTMEHFADMNRVYERYFPADQPVRTTIAVSGLPRGSLVEIEVTALASGGS